MGTKKRGGSYARSEAELEQIVDGLYEQEVSLQYTHTHTYLQSTHGCTRVDERMDEYVHT